MHRTNQNDFFILVNTYAMPAQNMLWSHPYCNGPPEFTKHLQNYMFSIPEKHKLTRFYGFFWWLHPLMSPSAPCTKALGRVFPTASLRSLIAFSVRLTWGHGFGPETTLGTWGWKSQNFQSEMAQMELQPKKMMGLSCALDARRDNSARSSWFSGHDNYKFIKKKQPK